MASTAQLVDNDWLDTFSTEFERLARGRRIDPIEAARRAALEPRPPELIEQEWVRDALGPILLPRDVRHLLDISAARLTERRSKQHNIFAVPTASGRLYVYPAYQFDLDEKRLLRAVPSTVQRLLPLTTDLQLAVWFASSNDKIDRREPRELLDAPDQLEPAVAAAEYRWSH
jgi:hypothetical protein